MLSFICLYIQNIRSEFEGYFSQSSFTPETAWCIGERSPALESQMATVIAEKKLAYM